VLGGHDHFYK
jgi:5'-nucleotidase